jgi:Fe-S cluster assembly scaffold protein SufB
MLELTNREKEILEILEVDLSSFMNKKNLVDKIKSSYKSYKKTISKPSSSAIPKIIISNNSSTVEHEASVGKVSEKQLFYLRTRGLDQNAAISLIITKNFSEILSNLPLEFAIEARKLIEMNLELKN